MLSAALLAFKASISLLGVDWGSHELSAWTPHCSWRTEWVFYQTSSNTTIELHAGLGIAEVDWRGDGDLCTVLARQP